ncbi:ATP-grasp domain-containing protein [Alteromonas sp. a30]|uniref:ATP-grasp domain-containing protein n=1 Tax=Alteromonas sp. a30 TaxID=2730917 RepID=UPI002282836F|nr:ATP-grasp domain-containing protein [Alteromonas sp. a30]MCY7294565.1 ATP-grasp domain-containing protein [Alteromonas sp. a30]
MNIIILNPFNKFPDSERWDFELINYDDFIDHTVHHVTYIADDRGLSGVPSNVHPHQLIKIENFGQNNELKHIIENEITRLGKVDRLISFSENHMDLLAELREAHDIPGPDIAETLRARDKVVMKQYVGDAGLRIPYFMHLHPQITREEVTDFVAKTGYPLIFKPTNGASSIGVQKLTNDAELTAALALVDSENWELEEFVEGKVLHIDGIVDAAGKVQFCIPSVYINTLFDYLRGTPTGSYIIEPNDPLYQQANAFTEACITALHLSACPFHLELIVTPENELVFLETAARVAGADIPYMIADCTGVNLFAAWTAMIMGEQPNLTQVEHKSGGWLLFGLPPELPVKVAKATPFKGKVDTLYNELVPEIGSIVTKPRGYCALQAGRFLFADNEFENVQNAMEYVLQHFEFNAEELNAS